MDAWKTILSFWGAAYFQGQTVSFREGNLLAEKHAGVPTYHYESFSKHTPATQNRHQSLLRHPKVNELLFKVLQRLKNTSYYNSPSFDECNLPNDSFQDWHLCNLHLQGEPATHPQLHRDKNRQKASTTLKLLGNVASKHGWTGPVGECGAVVPRLIWFYMIIFKYIETNMASWNIYQCCGYRYLSISNSKSYVYMNTISSKCAVNTGHLFQCHLFTQWIFFGGTPISLLFYSKPWSCFAANFGDAIISVYDTKRHQPCLCAKFKFARLEDVFSSWDWDDWTIGTLFLSEKKMTSFHSGKAYKKKSEVSGIHFCKKNSHQ